MKSYRYLLIPAIALITGCIENKEQQKSKSSEEQKTEKMEEADNTAEVSEDIQSYAGTLAGPEYFPIVELALKNGKFTIKESYGIDAKIGTIYDAEYIEGKVVALGKEKDFYKWTLPTFQFKSKNKDTLIFNSGVGPQNLIRTTTKLPDVTFLPPKNND